MRKLFITGVLLCSAIILIGAQTGFAWNAYDGGCQTCHGTGFAALSNHARSRTCSFSLYHMSCCKRRRTSNIYMRSLSSSC